MPDTRQDAATRMRTPLLALITEEALERDYQVVAQRRPRKPGGYGVTVVVALVGVLVTVAAVQTSVNADADDASRASLIERIEARSDAVSDLQHEISDQRAANAEAEDALLELGNVVNSVEADATRLGAVTGFTPVVGEGIRIELDNAEYSDPDTEHIRDSDLALLVNALWSAGAEAVSVNGQRISARTAVRNSGTAIEVNSVGIAPPYVVQAVGSTDTLSARLVETSSGAAFAVLAGDYGWSYDVDNVDELRLPAAPPRLRQLRSAERAADNTRLPEGES